MRAFKYDYEAPSKFVWTDAFPEVSKLGKDEIVVAPLYVGLNPVDYKVPDVAPLAKSRKDTPVGIDFVGRVVQVGPKVVDLKVDDLVFGASQGALAERIVAKTKTVAKVPQMAGEGGAVPAGLEQYAALPVAALTAWQGLKAGGSLNAKTPRRILVLGASGGVGHFAVQLGKKTNPVGTKVIAVTSTKNVEFVKNLGADEVLDYTEIGFDLARSMETTGGGAVDMVLDCVSPDYDYEPVARKCLKKEGMYVAANSGRTSDWVRSGLSSYLPFDVQRGGYKLVMVEVNTKDLEEVGQLVNQGKVKATIQREVAFNEEAIREAMDLLKSHRTVGKILVKF